MSSGTGARDVLPVHSFIVLEVNNSELVLENIRRYTQSRRLRNESNRKLNETK